MKELISAVIFVAGIVGGSAALKTLHDNVRKAALEKAAHGLLALSEINRSFRSRK